MTPRRRKLLLLGPSIALVICAVLSLHRFQHHEIFRLAFDALALLNFWLLYRYNLNHRQPDTLIHLFPVPPETSKERS
jgi:hypothetical protein